MEYPSQDRELVEQLKLQIEKQKRFFNTILDASFNGVYALGAVLDGNRRIVDFRYLFVNNIIASLLKLTPQEAVGRTLLELLPENRANGFFDIFCKVLRDGQPLRNETHFASERFTGWFEYVMVPVDEHTIVVTVQDITVHKKAVEELTSLHMELEKNMMSLRQTNASLEEFAYAASHDMKEPLRKINLFAGRLRESLGANVQNETEVFLEKIEKACTRMTSLIDDLLDYSEIDRSDNEMLEKVDLGKVLGQVKDSLEHVIQEKGAKVHCSPLPVISGRPHQLYQLFLNLVGNGLKYHRDGLLPSIEVNYETAKGRSGRGVLVQDHHKEFHHIVVSDNGIGFDPEDSEKIFNVFTRLHPAEKYRGTGIGLSIARKVVQGHSGYLWADGQPGKGASFHIFLPAWQ